MFNQSAMANCHYLATKKKWAMIWSLVTLLGSSAFAITVDNSQTVSVAALGAWSASTFSPGYMGSNYLHDGNTGKGTKTFEFKVPITVNGNYEVSLSVLMDANRASNVPVTVIDFLGEHKAFINQSSLTPRKESISLGIYTFRAGVPARILIQNAGTDGYVVVDSVSVESNAKGVAARMKCSSATDNSSSLNILSGSWPLSTYNPVHCGSNYAHDNNTNKGASVFKFNYPITSTGTYDAYLSVVSGANRAGGIPVTIQGSSSGTKTMTVNQFASEEGQHWLPLGAYNYSAGAKATISVSNKDTEGYVTADAIRLVKRSPGTPYNLDGSLGSYRLAWSDEFNGTSLDTGKWVHRTDTKGLSTQLPANVSVSNGALHLAVKKQTVGSMQYTGAGVISKARFKYGYYEARFKIPAGAGWHTSFWTHKHDGSGTTAIAGAVQEIDICENDSNDKNSYIGGVWAWADRNQHPQGHERISTSNLASEYNIWGAEFTPTQVRYYFNGELTHVRDMTVVTQGDANIWLTSIGYIGPIDNARLPSTADYDYVRFFTKVP
ncbi:MAG: family 16 glycosylhydrolase [Pseudobdellovibrionaceae bacterium]